VRSPRVTRDRGGIWQFTVPASMVNQHPSDSSGAESLRSIILQQELDEISQLRDFFLLDSINKTASLVGDDVALLEVC